MTSIIDFHTHAFPDFLAEKAVDTLEKHANMKAVTGGTVADVLALMDRNGVDKAVVLSIATKVEQTASILKWSRSIASDRIVPFASVHPESPTLAEDVEAVARAGLKGIKLHPLYQEFYVDEPRAFPVYEAIRDAGLILLCHAGYDMGFGDDDLASPERFVPVVERFPDLKLVLAHLGGWRRFDVFLERLAGSNVTIDTSFAHGWCPSDLLEKILSRHGADRIVFATDTPWMSMADQIAYVRSFPIADEDKAKILYGNAAALLGIA